MKSEHLTKSEHLKYNSAYAGGIIQIFNNFLVSLNYLLNLEREKKKKKKKKTNCYIGACMFVRMFAYCICVCKPKFLAYAILMVLHILHWLAIPILHCFLILYKLNHTLRLLPQNDWSVRTCQRGLLSVPDSSYNSRNPRSSDQTA